MARVVRRRARDGCGARLRWAEVHPSALDKLAWLAAARSRLNASFRLGLDGGIASDTIGPVAAAGGELIVAGIAVMRASDYGRAITDLEALARRAAA